MSRYSVRQTFCVVLVATVAIAMSCFAEVRDWTNRQGKTLTGELVEVDGETVKLRSEKSGKVYSVAIDNLTDEDQAFLRRQASSGPTADDGLGPALARLAGVEFSPTMLIVLAILNLPLYFLWGKVLFTDWAGFLEALRFWITPDSWSFFRGEYMEDWFAEVKLFFWVAGSVATVLGEYCVLQKYVF